MRRILIIPVIAGILLTMSACGSKEETTTSPTAKSSSDSDQSTTTKATTSDDDTDTTDAGGTTDDSTDIGDLPDALGGDCLELAMLYGQVMAQSGAVFGTEIPADELEKLDEQIAAAKAKVPDEIKDAFDTWSAAWSEFNDKMAEISENGGMLDPSNVDKLEEATAVLEEPEVEAANEELSTYFETECGN